MEVFLKQKVKLPQEHVLAGNAKERISYKQSNITKWMTGFCRIIREECSS